MIEISTSILNMIKGKESETIFALEKAKTDYFHIDVMDGKFVKNNTYNDMLEVSSYIKRISNLPMDVHLMVEDVKKGIEDFLSVEPNIITFHLEACSSKEEVFKLIELIKNNNCRIGISIKPNTSIEEIKKFLPYIHYCLVMTVKPGKGGQKLIDLCINKIKELKKYIDEQNLDTFIEADGGINLENVKKLKEAGVDVVVAGSAIINASDAKEVITEMKNK